MPRSLALTVLAVIASIAALHFGRGFFVPLLVGILISYGLHPVVEWLNWVRIPRAIGAALVVAIAFCGPLWVTYSLADEATVVIEKLPEAARKLRHMMSALPGASPSPLQNVQAAAEELQGAAADAGAKPGPKPRAAPAPAAPKPASSWISDYALSQSALLASVAAQAPIVLLLAYFLLASGDHFRRKLVQVVPTLSQKKDALRILEEIDSQVQRYLFVMLVSNTLLAAGIWMAFGAMGMEQAGIWGVCAGVLHFIPYIGTVVFVFAAAVAAFLQFGTFVHALAVVGAAILISGLVGMVFMTWLQSRFASVNAAALFIALLFFGWLWGVPGLLLGAPLVAIAKVICDRVESLHPAGELLGA